MASVDLATGSTFAGRYRILRRLASGGMGAVYEVLHLETRRRRALKVMLPELFVKPELRDRFRREAHVTASVRSEHLVDVFDAGVDEPSGMPFIVMELLEGEDLGWLVQRTGPLTPSAVVAHLAQVASALDRTHAASIVHRDLKPENLFLTHRDDGSPCVKILDFGISKVVDQAATGGRNTTSIGTPAYMAPEQIVGGDVTPAADLHSLALVAYTLLTGRAYWQDDVESTDNALAFALRAARGIREGAVSRARRHGHTLPDAFEAWFSRAVDLDPKKRFTTASDMVRGLAEALGVPSPTPSPRSSNAGVPATDPERASAPPPRAEGDFVPSTMHGAELGPKHKKPARLVLYVTAGVALGLVLVVVTELTFGQDDSPLPAASSTAGARTPSGAADSTVPRAESDRGAGPVVMPLEDAFERTVPAASASQRRGLAAGKTGGAPPSPIKLNTSTRAEVPSTPASTPSPSPSPSISASASFPAASSAPRVKYTRD